MTLEQIKAAVKAGKSVHWKNDAYRVIHGKGGWLIVCDITNDATGLTWQDGVTMNGREEDFYVQGDRR